MALTHQTAIRNGIANYVTGEIDTGGAGTLQFQTSGDVECATVTFSATAFTGAAGGVDTADTITSDTSATGGDVTKFRIFNGSATEIMDGNVQTSGGDINLSSLSVGVGDTVSMSSLTYTAPV